MRTVKSLLDGKTFKLGSSVIVTASNLELHDHDCDKLIESGGRHIITKFGGGSGYQLDGMLQGWVKHHMIKLAPKWSIYNNDIKWGELSDKRKGKMLLANHSGVSFSLDGGPLLFKPEFNRPRSVYKAIEPVLPVLPVPPVTRGNVTAAYWASKIEDMKKLVLIDGYKMVDLATHYGVPAHTMRNMLHKRGHSIVRWRHDHKKSIKG